MAIEFNLVKLGKMLDRAGHPGTPDPERVISIAKAYSYCSANGNTFADVAACMGDSMFIEVAKVPHHDLLAQLADLEMARDDDAIRIGKLEEHIAALTASHDRLREKCEASHTEVDRLQSDNAEFRRMNEELRSGGTQATPTIDVQDEQTAVCSAQEASPSIVESLGEEAEAVQHAETAELDDVAWTRFEKLAQLGTAKGTIARRLSKLLGRIVSYAVVSRWMRERWCPESGSRFALRHAHLDPVYC